MDDGSTEVRIRRIAEADGALLRQLRLAALCDAPSAFGSSFARERAMSVDRWEQRASAGATGRDSASWFAFDTAGEPIGLVAGYRPEPDSTVLQLVSMWVVPTARRLGVGRQLVGVVLNWARACGDAAVELRVNESNRPAIGLYERLGFVRTGETTPLESDPTLMTIVLRRRF